MLDMGFGRDVKRIEEFIPAERQTLLFSATLPPEIREMAEGMMRNPARVAITPEKPAVERIEQSVCFVERQHKLPLFLHFWKKETDSGKNGLTLVFARTKVGANRLSGLLRDEGVKVEAIHGNKSQSQREHALKNFRDKKSPILIATDIAARGIDVKGITLVINYDLPDDPESYVHRIGRTARAGAEGRAIAFCSHDELLALRDVEKFMKRAIPVFKFEHPFQSDSIASKYRPWTVNPPRGGEQSNLPDIRKNKFMRQGSDRANSGGGGGRRPDRSGSGSRKFEKKPFRAGGQGGAPRPDSTAGFGNTGPKKEPFFKKLWNSVTPGNDAGRPPSRDEIPRSERSYGSKPAGGPKPYGQKPSFGKKPYGGGGFKKKY
jgi:ATP-dependent RNA helicase RhlE